MLVAVGAEDLHMSAAISDSHFLAAQVLISGFKAISGLLRAVLAAVCVLWRAVGYLGAVVRIRM